MLSAQNCIWRRLMLVRTLILFTIFTMGPNLGWASFHRCEESYIPPHTYEDLQEVSKWAAGGAFYSFAKNANYFFDREAYNRDNPNLALFNFGRATGTSCLEIDVLKGYISMVWVFESFLKKANRPKQEVKRTFRDFYTEAAVKQGFDIYLSEL